MREDIRFYGLSDTSPSQVTQAWAQSTLNAADRLLEHRFRYLALGEVDLGPEVVWNREVKAGLDTPLAFAPWMDYRDTKSYGDFKYFWELPRLQHLITLAKAHWLTGRAGYAEEVQRQIAGFVDQSPYLVGVNWTMPMEASIRLVSLCWVAALAGTSTASDPKTRAYMEWILRTHVDYVVSNYAAYSSANNHLVGEAAGVFVACACFPAIDPGARKLRLARRILEREIAAQHHPDGVNREQAVHYQAFALYFFLLAGLLARDNGMDFSPAYWETLERSAGFLAALATDDGHVPQIGDSDDGRAIVLQDGEAHDERSLLAVCGVLFSRPDWVRKAGPCDETVLWLLGPQGVARFEELAGRAQGVHTGPSGLAFEQGGYYLMSAGAQGQITAIVDCGPLGYRSIAAHGHADALSLVLTVQGRPLLVDPGTYTYVAKDPYRNYFRSTRAHNTVEVDGLDQSEMLGPFLWGRHANAFVDQWTHDDQGRSLTGWHDGYQGLPDPVIHRRTVRAHACEPVVTITDQIECRGAHEVALHFHLDPSWGIQTLGGNRFEVERDGIAVRLDVDESLTVDPQRGCEDPIAGWVSPAYDVKVPAVTLRCSSRIQGTRTFVTRVQWVGRTG